MPVVFGVEFKVVANWPAYAVGDNGTIWSRWIAGKRIMSDQWRQLPNRVNQRGRISIALCGERGERSWRFLHQLILEAFIGPCPEGMEACHYPDLTPNNCALSNLRWDTRLANREDARKHGTLTRGTRINTSKLTEDQVRIIRSELEQGASQRSLARKFSVEKTTIARIGQRKIWSWLE